MIDNSNITDVISPARSYNIDKAEHMLKKVSGPADGDSRENCASVVYLLLLQNSLRTLYVQLLFQGFISNLFEYIVGSVLFIYFFPHIVMLPFQMKMEYLIHNICKSNFAL